MNDAIYPALGFADPLSSWLHLLGAGVFALAGYLLVRRAWDNTDRVVALVVFVFCGVFALSMSGVYHLLAHGGTPRLVLRRLDYAGIFALIAGTFTALHTVLFLGAARWVVIVLIWVIAATAIPLTMIFFNDMPEWLMLSIYIGMGWIGLVSAFLVSKHHGWQTTKPLLWGGVAYTTGAVLEYLRWPVLIPHVIGPHELFHVGVLAGLAWHTKLIYAAINVDKGV